MDDTHPLDFEDLPAADKRQVNEVCERFETALQAGHAAPLEEFLNTAAESLRPVLVHELLLLECEFRLRRGEPISVAALAARVGCSESAAAAIVDQAHRYAEPVATESATGPLPIVGRFRLRRELGRGGCGVVYLARDTHNHADVALKLPLLPTLFVPDLRRRFLREARAAARLNHPGIVRVREVDADGPVCYIAADYEPGPSLAAWLRTLTAAGKLPSFTVAAELTAALADALAHAHARGVLHCDLKPANILLSLVPGHLSFAIRNDQTDLLQQMTNDQGPMTPKITDFGLARLLYEVSDLSSSGQVLGTPLYMAPEQAAGHRDALTERADVYALGAILFELLTGGPPFAGGTTLEVMYRVLHDDAPGPRSRRAAVPPALDAVCRKCLEKGPAHRYASAAALAADLRRWLAGQPVLARPPGLLARARSWGRRHPARAALIGAGLLMAGALAGGGWVAEGRVREQRDRAVYQQSEAETERDRARALADKLDRVLNDTEAAQLLRAQMVLKAGQPGMAREHLEAVPVGREGWEWWYLRRACQGSVLTLLGHTATVTAVAVSPDGRRFASGDKDAMVRLWDARTGQPVGTFHVASPVVALAFSPDSSCLAVAGRSGPIEVRDAATCRVRVSVTGHTHRTNGIAFSPAGDVLASCGADAAVRLWDAHTGQLVATWATTPPASVNALAFTPDGRALVSAGDDFSVRLWDVRTGQVRRTWTVPPAIGRLTGVAISPDGARLAAGGSQLDRLFVWPLHGPGPTVPTTMVATDVPHGMNAVAFHPDGTLIAAAGGNSVINLRDAATGSLVQRLAGHTDPVLAIAFTPDGRGLLSGGYDRTVRLWDLRASPTGPCRRLPFDGPTFDPAFSPDGRYLAIGMRDGARVWDSITGWPVLTLTGHRGAVRGVSFRPDGRRLVTAGQDGTARLWDFPSGRAGPVMHNDRAPRPDLGRGPGWERYGHPGELWGAIFSPDGRSVATFGDDDSVRLWDADTGAPLRTLGPFAGRVFAATFSPDGDWLAVGAGIERGSVEVVDLASGRPLWPAAALLGRVVRGLAFSPDGRRLAAATIDDIGSVQIWDARTGRVLRALQGHRFSFAGVAWLPDGRRLVGGGLDGDLRIWGPDRNASVLELPGAQGDVWGVAVSRDGRIATTSQDGPVCIWEAETAPAVLEFQGHSDEVLCAAFSPDGRRLATGGRDRTVRLWDANTSRALAALSGHAGEVVRVAFSADGRRLLSTDDRGGIGEWDATTGELLTMKPGRQAAGERPGLPTGEAAHVASPDGRTVAYLCKRIVYLVRPPDERERARRLWATRPDPRWHVEQARRCAAQHRSFAAEFHQRAAERARAALAEEEASRLRLSGRSAR